MKGKALRVSFVLLAVCMTLVLGVFISKAAEIQVTLGWTPNQEPDMATYEIYQAEILGSDSGPFVLVGIVDHPTTQITVTVDDVKNWIWQAYALDTSGNRSIIGSNTETLRDEVGLAAVQGLSKQ